MKHKSVLSDIQTLRRSRLTKRGAAEFFLKATSKSVWISDKTLLYRFCSVKMLFFRFCDPAICCGLFLQDVFFFTVVCGKMRIHLPLV